MMTTLCATLLGWRLSAAPSPAVTSDGTVRRGGKILAQIPQLCCCNFGIWRFRRRRFFHPADVQFDTPKTLYRVLSTRLIQAEEKAAKMSKKKKQPPTYGVDIEGDRGIMQRHVPTGTRRLWIFAGPLPRRVARAGYRGCPGHHIGIQVARHV
jgi:hypothetical protein